MNQQATTQASWDLIVVGGDLEGLAAAAEAARSGLRTLLVVEESAPGGTARARELAPGFRANGLVNDLATTTRSLLEPLQLDANGLEWHTSAPARYGVSPNGTLARVDDDQEIAREFGPEVAKRYGQWRRWTHKLAEPLRALLLEAPPEFAQLKAGDTLQLMRKLLGLRRIGRADFYELLRAAPQSAWDLAEERFDTDGFGAAWVAPALLGLPHGPRAPGSGGLCLLEALFEGPTPIGGPPALAEALYAAARRSGAGVRLDACVERVLLENRSVTGVALADGTELKAPRVLSTGSLKRALLDWFEPGDLGTSLAHVAEHWRTRGTVAVLTLALERSPMPDVTQPVRIVTAAKLAQIERSVDAHWVDELPEEPALVVDLDPTAGPSGGAILTAQIHGVRRPAGGWNDARRAQLERVARRALVRVLPRLEDPSFSELLTPEDIERRFGLDGGHLGGGETSLDRLWIRRPHLALSRYATPIAGFYLGGQAAHPGASFRTGSGILAARRIVADAGSI